MEILNILDESIISIAGSSRGLFVATRDRCLQFDRTTMQPTLLMSESIDNLTVVDNHLFYSKGSEVFKYDLRSSCIVSKFNMEEEVNAIDVTKINIGAADDTGMVRVFDERNSRYITAREKHSNIASTFKFRPSVPSQMVSGGFDCQLLWSDSIKGRTLGNLNFHSDAMCNPPHIHSMCWMDCNTLAVGLGDGNIRVVTIPRKKGELIESNLKGHSWAVSCLAVEGTKIISGSIDESIRIWESGSSVQVPLNDKVNCLALMDGVIYAGGVLRLTKIKFDGR